MRSPLLLRVVFSDTLPHPALRRMLHEHRLRDERQLALSRAMLGTLSPAVQRPPTAVLRHSITQREMMIGWIVRVWAGLDALADEQARSGRANVSLHNDRDARSARDP